MASPSPHKDCYFPAEWQPHAACILLYPHNANNFTRLHAAQQQVLNLVQTIANEGEECVLLLCPSDMEAQHVQNILSTNSSSTRCPILVRVCPSNDTWARDTAPTFLISKETTTTKLLVGLDWDFNAYGGQKEGCYWPCTLDQHIASQVCSELNSPETWEILQRHAPIPDRIQHIQVPIVLEGGAIHTDGLGTILTTKECLLNPNRNPTYSQNDLAKFLCEYTNSRKVIWLPTGLAYDEDTNGHVDNFACFVQPGKVVLAWTDDEKHDPENYQRCREAYQTLATSTDACGGALTVHKLYLPSPPLFYTKDEVGVATTTTTTTTQSTQSHGDDFTVITTRQVGQRLAASYVNFYIANQAVLVPQFGVPKWDQKALETLTPLFPNRKVVGVSSREILLGGGNIHCFTQQVPAVL